jgi:hypothetical protein
MKAVHSFNVLMAFLLAFGSMFVLGPTFTALADNTTTNNAGTGTNVDSGGPAWTAPGNITAAGTPYASVLLISSSTPSDYLRGSNYGFAIPADATITGVEVVVNRRQTTAGGNIYDSLVQLVNDGGTLFGSNYATATNWPTGGLGTATYGGATDMWGLTTATLTPAIINDTDFGVYLSARRTGGGDDTATVDYMQITVYYKRSTTTAVECGGGTPVVTVGSPINCVATVTRAGGSNTPTLTVTWKDQERLTLPPAPFPAAVSQPPAA